MSEKTAELTSVPNLGTLKKAVAVSLILAIVGLIAVFAFAPRRSVDRLGAAPEFKFEKVPQGFLSRSDLLGRVWVGGFMFTSCQGICPALSAKMQALQKDFASEPKFHLVSFSIDPDRDTSAVLSQYREKWSGASTWDFTRPSRKELEAFAKELKLVIGEVGDFAHTSRVVLVDQSGWVRGYYQTTDEDQLRRLRQDIDSLLSE